MSLFSALSGNDNPKHGQPTKATKARRASQTAATVRSARSGNIVGATVAPRPGRVARVRAVGR